MKNRKLRWIKWPVSIHLFFVSVCLFVHSFIFYFLQIIIYTVYYIYLATIGQCHAQQVIDEGTIQKLQHQISKLEGIIKDLEKDNKILKSSQLSTSEQLSAQIFSLEKVKIIFVNKMYYVFHLCMELALVDGRYLIKWWHCIFSFFYRNWISLKLRRKN